MSLSQQEIHAAAFSSKKYLFAFIALFIIPLSGVAIDIYVPSLPEVSRYFNVDKSFVQLTIATYMFGMGFMQLFAGGISDSFGRKKPFLLGVSIFIVCTLIIPFSHNVYQLLVMRALQGVTVALVSVSMRAVITDLFTGPSLYKMFTYMTMAWSIGPIIAPVIGSYLQHYFGWQACFYFLVIYSVIGLLLVLFFVPETSAHRHPFHITAILQRYREILFHRQFLAGVFINGVLYSLIISFSIIGPFLIQNVLHYSPVQFGRVVLLTGLVWFLGTMTNRFLLNVKLQRKGLICFWSMLAVAIINFIFAIMVPLNIYSIIIPFCLLLWLGGIVFPNYFALGVVLFPKTTGSANALAGAFIFLISSASSGLGTFLKSTSSIPLAVTYIGLVGICLIVHSFSKLD